LPDEYTPTDGASGRQAENSARPSRWAPPRRRS